MRRMLVCLIFLVVFLCGQAGINAQNIVVPAGTLLKCTLDEPNFSSATADIGDPVVCHLSSLREFGQNVFPRGSYLGGHLEADKEPGHFVGKGYLKIEFDRIGFPSTDIPVPSKVIAAKDFHVDKKGDIRGKGHAKRDIIEWMIPPLWPWKILMLPARGPRPTLKGETQITVRLMDDIEVPRVSSNYRSFEKPASYERPPAYYHPQKFDGHKPNSEKPAPSTEEATYDSANSTVTSPNITATDPTSAIAEANTAITSLHEATVDTNTVTTNSVEAMVDSTAAGASEKPVEKMADVAYRAPNTEAAERPAATPTQPLRLKMIALKSKNVYAVTKYRVSAGSVSYVLASGASGSIDNTEVDWRATSRLNAEPTMALNYQQR